MRLWATWCECQLEGMPLDPDDLWLLIDGVPTPHYPVAERRRVIGLVRQYDDRLRAIEWGEPTGSLGDVRVNPAIEHPVQRALVFAADAILAGHSTRPTRFAANAYLITAVTTGS